MQSRIRLFSHICFAIYFVIFTVCSVAIADECSSAPSAISIRSELVGGSNYISFGNITTYLNSLQKDSATGKYQFNPDLLLPVVGAYHLNPQKVESQLKVMVASGQQLISLPIWFGSPRIKDTSKGFGRHLVYSNGGALQAQQRDNLANITRKIRSVGFKTMIVRFIPQGHNNPYQWKVFDDALYRENLAFVLSTVALIKQELAGSGIKLLVDLGGEQGGNPMGENKRFVQKLWADFCEVNKDCDLFSYFSINPVPPAIQPRIRNQYVWLKESGGRQPKIVAVDVYGYGGGVNRPVQEWDVYSQLLDVASEITASSGGSGTLLIQESFYNDKKSAEDIARFSNRAPLKLLAVVQWPNSRTVMNEYYTKKITNFASVDYPENFCYYLGQISKK